ncbi:MAG: non-hydrolyzing UDP-N-acetylglucosamine 2-epimerase [Candidatus Binatia bacterium]
MKPKTIIVVAGARPNFMKVGPVLQQLSKYPNLFAPKLVHTGQHYDADMSDVFFADLDLPQPDCFLGIGSGSHAEQTGTVMIAFEKVCLEERPDLVVVVGDVNSTLACALTAKKLYIAVAHVEAGLRSRDWTMPEEVNRVVTDAISDLLYTPSRDADRNLLHEGIPPEKIHFVGNVMIDSLLAHLAKADNRDTLARLGVESGRYATLTLHRPSNVDAADVLAGIIDVLVDLSRELPIIWPLHPRAKKNLEAMGLLKRLEAAPGMKLTDPLGYLDMLALNRRARMIITDSGGLQEEATALAVPCITLRENTERPVTVECGCNEVVGNRPDAIRGAVFSALTRNGQTIRAPEFWDGKAAERIVETLIRLYS